MFSKKMLTVLWCAARVAAYTLFVALLPMVAFAQTRDLTVVVLVNSSNATGYNPDPNHPGEYQMFPERYLENLQVPYRVVDVSTTSAQDLSNVQLIVAGHKGINMPSDWQSAIVSAVAGGVGFVNLDSDPNIGAQSHIQKIFGATSSTQGSPQQTIVIPAAVQVGGTSPHYIAALQKHWAGDPAGDIVYQYHGNGVTVIESSATILQGAHGTVVAELGTDPLILATSYQLGSAVNFGTYDYLHADRFGFVMGVDDLFWRSLVWAARKPFVLRGYPKLAAIQMDDNEPGWITRVRNLYDTSITGTLASDGTGGPWKPQGNLQLSSLSDAGGERAQLINDVKAGFLHVSPHGNDYGTAGDLYYNLTVPNTDAAWLSALNYVTTWQQGQGGSDVFPKFGRSMVPHFWDLSNNAGYDMWNTLGTRYVTTPQMPGAYYFTTPRPASQRMALRPFRIYEQPPIYTGDYEETFPIFYADDVTVGSRSGLPAKTFYGFCSQIELANGRFNRVDAIFPSSTAGYSVANSLNQWEFYAWRFWSGMMPVQIYTHDGDNMELATTSDVRSFVQQLSTWFNQNHTRHMYMDEMGDYLRARNKSLLTTASINSTAITLNFSGTATDADGNKIPTKAYIYYQNDEGTLLDVPGFSSGGSYSYANPLPPSISVTPGQITVSTTPGSTTPTQTIFVGNVGSGTFSWTVKSTASWLTTDVSGGVSGSSIHATINSASLAQGTYTGSLVVSAAGVANSPVTVPVTLTITPPQLTASTTSLSFNSFVNQPAPPSQTIQITNTGGGVIGWAASSDQPWLTTSSASGPTPSNLTVFVNPAGMTVGNWVGHLTLTATGASGVKPVVIPVTFGLESTIETGNVSSLSGWIVSPLGNAAGWTASGGALHYNGGGESQLYTGSSSWTDYEFEVGITLPKAVDYPGGIRARVNPANGSGYALWMYPGEASLILYKVAAWNISQQYTSLGVASGITIDTNTHLLKLSVHGSTIQGFWDGKLVITATDSSYPTGLVALDPSNQLVNYSSANVTSSMASQASLLASPAGITFTGKYQGTNPTAQNLGLSASQGSMTWLASTNQSWLTLNASSGITPATIAVSANTAGKAAGTYQGAITLTPASGTPVNVPVTLNVVVPVPTLVVAPTSLSFNGYVGQSVTPATLAISNLSGGAFNWTATPSASWITVSPGSAAGAGNVTVGINATGMSPGNYQGTVTISASGLQSSPQAIPISLTLGTATLSDNFSNSALGWIISPNGLASGFSVANNTYSYSGIGNTQSCSGSGTWGDYEFDFALQLKTASNYPGGVRARVNPSTGAGYGLWFYPGDSAIKLLAISDWGLSSYNIVAQAGVGLDTSWHNYRLVFAGSQISIYQDGTLLFTATDSTYNTGYVCFEPSNQPVNYKSALVLSTTPAALLSTSAQSMSFSSQSNGASPAAQTLTVSSSYPVTFGVSSDASWLTVTPANGMSSKVLSVSVNTSGVSNGTYTGHLTIVSPGSSNGPLVIPVTLSVATGVIASTPTNLHFFSALGTSPAAQSVTVQNLGTGALLWTATSDSNWMSLSPTSGSAPGTLTFTPNGSSLPSGDNTANATLSSGNAANGSVIVPATVHVGNLAFSDSFTSGSGQWTPSPLGLAGNWTVANGSFNYNGGGHTQQFAGVPSWQNYIVSANITLSSLSDYPGGLRGRVNTTNGASYAAWLYPAEGLIKLFVVTGWSIDSPGLTQIGQSPVIAMNTSTHTMRLGFSGSKITVYYDNAAVIQATDSTYTSGAIALDVSSQPVSFGNVTVLQQ